MLPWQFGTKIRQNMSKKTIKKYPIWFYGKSMNCSRSAMEIKKKERNLQCLTRRMSNILRIRRVVKLSKAGQQAADTVNRAAGEGE